MNVPKMSEYSLVKSKSFADILSQGTQNDKFLNYVLLNKPTFKCSEQEV